MISRSICHSCALFEDYDPEDPGEFCEAFPQGIPDEIIRLGFDHRNEYPGDNGIRFVPDGDVDPAHLDEVTNPVEPPGTGGSAV